MSSSRVDLSTPATARVFLLPREPALQFQAAHTTMTTSSLTIREVHLHYLNSGGSFDEFELDAYLHGLAPLPREERDCIAQAVNELIDDLLASGACGDTPRATYSRTHSPRVMSTPPRPGQPCFSARHHSGL